jgi:hypothetical protein
MSLCCPVRRTWCRSPARTPRTIRWSTPWAIRPSAKTSAPAIASAVTVRASKGGSPASSAGPVDTTSASERNRGDRNDPRRTANRYLKRIRYGNRNPLLDPRTGQRPPCLAQAQIDAADWMLETVFDYGEHASATPRPDDRGPWTYRTDPFSSYRAGFEVRTTRLCRRVLMFHHFPDQAELGQDCLVRSTDFAYSSDRVPADPRNPIHTIAIFATPISGSSTSTATDTLTY